MSNLTIDLGIALLAIAAMFGIAHLATHAYKVERGQLWPDGQAEQRPDLSALFGPPERHLSSVKPLDKANLHASHSATVVPITEGRRRA